MDRNWNAIFQMVFEEVSDSCGDGDGTIVFHSTPVKLAAEKFEEWSSNHTWLAQRPYRRVDLSENHVLFTDGSNENIALVSYADREKAKTNWTQEVYLEVW